jgi:WD40 repeat protein
MRRITAIGVALATGLSFFVSLGGCPLFGTGGTIGGGTAFNIAPTPVITTDVTRGVVPLTVQFGSDRSTDDGLIVLRDWNFGDDSTSRDLNPRHTYTGTGEFQVTLTLTDDNGAASTRTTTIVVTDAPVPVISTDRTVIETAPGIVNFSGNGSFDPDGTIVEYRWDFGDGSREFLATVPHQFASPGNYKVTLTVTDNVGVQAFANVFIQVGIPQPTVEIRVPPPDVKNIVLSQGSPLWIQAVFSVDPSAARFTTAGLDGDRDPCEAQYALIAESTGAVTTRTVGHKDRVTRAVFSPDGASILTSSEDGTLRLTSATNNQLVKSIPASAPVGCVAFAPDGLTFAFGQANGEVALCSTASGAVLRTFAGHTAEVNDVAYSPSGAQILSGSSDRHAILWNVADGTILRDFLHGLAVNAVAFNPVDGAIVATASEDRAVQLWNTTSGENLRTLNGHTGGVQSLVFSPDGATLFSGASDTHIIAWNPANGANLGTFTGHTGAVVSLAVSSDGKTLYSGGAEGTLHMWNVDTRADLRSSTPCISPINSIDISTDGKSLLVGIGARNQVQLDTNPSNGNDLNLTYPVALMLDDVAPGQYFLWAQVDTDRSDPSRAYADAMISVIPPFSSAIGDSAPLVPYVDDEATIVFRPLSFNPDTRRQVVNLGSLTAGDRVHLALTTAPSFNDFFDPIERYSLALVDESNSIAAWYQSDTVLFSPNSRLIIGHSSARYYLIMDGGFGAHVKIDRNAGLNSRRQQRVLLRFDGSGSNAVTAADITDIVPPLNAADFNSFFVDIGSPDPGWGPNETLIMKQAIISTLNARFAGFDVVFVSSDDPQPSTPRLQMYVGGDNLLAYGVSDYIDPRNETLSGTGITFASGIGRDAIAGLFSFQATTPADVGVAIGNVAAHECGHLMGLRHVDFNITDIMNPDTDPLVGQSFQASSVSISEQEFGLPSIGVQDAPTLLLETVGPN